MDIETAHDSIPTQETGGPGGVASPIRTEAPGTQAAGAPEASIEEVDRLLDEVERALSRLDDGTYGRCVACGAHIDDARLAAEPTVLTCGRCATDPDGQPTPTVSTAVPGSEGEEADGPDARGEEPGPDLADPAEAGLTEAGPAEGQEAGPAEGWATR